MRNKIEREDKTEEKKICLETATNGRLRQEDKPRQLSQTDTHTYTHRHI